MADIAVTAAQVARIFPDRDEAYDFIAGATITAGQPVYFSTTTGKLGVADANAGSNADQFRGIAINGGGAGQAITVLMRGFVGGYTLTSQSYDDPLYLSDTAGTIADSAGSVTVQIGRVLPMPDSSLTKAVYIDALVRGPNWS